MLVWLCIRAIVVVCGRCVTASSVICVVASVHRQPFVPLHRATALCGCLYASLHNGFVWLSLCILAYRLFATTCKHPCLKPLGVHFRHPCLFMNALLALRPCKAFGRSFQASLPLYERSVGFASVQSLWAFISGILALLAPPVTSTADITASLANSLPSA